MILEQIGRQGSLLLRLLALGRPESELPGRLGAGMMLRPIAGGARGRRAAAAAPERGFDGARRRRDGRPGADARGGAAGAQTANVLGAGALGPTRVAVYKRHPQDGAAATRSARSWPAWSERTQVRGSGRGRDLGAHNCRLSPVRISFDWRSSRSNRRCKPAAARSGWCCSTRCLELATFSAHA